MNRETKTLLYKIKGKFQDYTEKETKTKYVVKQAIFQIDNRYGNNMEKGRFEDIPFIVYGSSMETAKNLKFNQEAEISFRVGGGNGFVNLSAATITPGKEDTDANIQF